jgi:DNA transformation protein
VAVSREWEAFVLEQLSALGRVRARRMFGGVGLYLDETFFGLVVGDAGDVYFKVDDGNRAAYEGAGCGPFRPFAERGYAMSFWRVPAEVIDDPDEMTTWAREAVGAARRSATAKSRPRQKRRRSTEPPAPDSPPATKRALRPKRG